MAEFCLLLLPLLLIFISPIFTANAAAAFTLVNRCQETIWPAIYTNAGTAELSSTGFALPAGASETIPAAASWGGSIWARTHCTNDSNGANFRCLTGDCGTGTAECSGKNRTPPATLAEFQADPTASFKDFYDVSLVDGFNVPILVASLGGGGNCGTTGCPADLNADCPSELKMTGDGGEVLGCRSPCSVFGKAEYCCNGSYSSPDACKPNNYSEIFKKQCPQAYSYAFDDAASTFSCIGSVYTITFCPPPNASQVTSNLPGDARNVIRPGDRLNSSSKLVSEGGNFTLGFFTVPQTNLSYLGIWYTSDEQRKVWVANPDSPIAVVDSQTQLAMDETGNLILSSGRNSIRNVTDQVVTNNNTLALLLDSGNFILMDSGSRNRTIWQSFDHPTDTLLPGSFTLSLERAQDSGQLVIRRRGVIYWTSGPWNNQGFPSLPLLNASFNRFIDKVNLTSADDGVYFTFETLGSSLSMLALSPEGQIVDVANSGLIVSPYQEFCYGYEGDNGCASSALPSCRSSRNTFQSKSGSFFGDNGNYDENSNVSLSDCMEKCWNDCNCNGFTVSSNGTGCITWTQKKEFRLDESGQTVKKYVLAAEKSPKGKCFYNEF
ncbi:OLC1v1031069C2 [Oldenlandia corymbosa var. corymbosa]|uniref:OLC1v1031069C2 n=1 Tax=Oldenlandia corymbosa var. corymbosa TaxID=529605 RepID=A0AAV1CI62_OLDCO|nr:OLC1v1031069C2 [Oldenlandia corymbosa var. corymbosa]